MLGLLNLSAMTATEREDLRQGSGWLIALGVLTAALGFAALVFVGLTTWLAVVFVGWGFLIAGVAQTVHAVVRRGWSGFLVELFSGLLTAIVGGTIVAHPLAGASVLTIVVGVVFLVAGLMRVAAALGTKTPYSGWLVLHGLVSAALGGFILAEWPESLVWVIGTLVGFDLIVSGGRTITFGLALRSLPPESDERPPIRSQP